MARGGRWPAMVLALLGCVGVGEAAAQRDGPPALRLESPAGPGSLRLVNLAVTVVEVAGAIAVEWRDGTAWRPLGTEFNVVEQCRSGSGAPATVRLALGTMLTVVPWRGYSCSSQCARSCRGNVYFGPNVFRPVVTVLPGGERVIGPEWVLAARAPGQ